MWLNCFCFELEVLNMLKLENYNSQSYFILWIEGLCCWNFILIIFGCHCLLFISLSGSEGLPRRNIANVLIWCLSYWYCCLLVLPYIMLQSCSGTWSFHLACYLKALIWVLFLVQAFPRHLWFFPWIKMSHQMICDTAMI